MELSAWYISCIQSPHQRPRYTPSLSSGYHSWTHPLLVILLHLLSTSLTRLLQLSNLPARRAPVGQQLNAELAQADAEQLQQPRLPRIQRLALLADNVVVALAGLVAEADLALDHAGGHAKAAELGLERVGDGHVVLGGDLATGRVQGTGGDGDGSGGDRAGARKVDLCQVDEVVLDFRGVAVGEDEADGAGQVLGELVEPVGLGVLGGGAEGAGGELGLAEEDAVAREEVFG